MRGESSLHSGAKPLEERRTLGAVHVLHAEPAVTNLESFSHAQSLAHAASIAIRVIHKVIPKLCTA